MNYNQNSGYGQAILNRVQQVIPVFGKIFVVCPATDTNYGRLSQVFPVDPEGVVRLFKSIESAYAAMTNNQDDVMVLAANGSHTLAAALTVAKNRVHFIGLDGGNHLIQQRTKIVLADVTADIAANIINTGIGNTFTNIKVINEGTHVNSIAAMIDQGEATVLKNVSVQKLSDLDQATVADFICEADSFTYEDCEFGADTVVQTVARPTFWVRGTGGVMKDGRARHLTFVAANTLNTKVHFKADANSFNFTNIFEDCNFMNSINGTYSTIQATVAASSNATNPQGVVMFVRPNCQAASFCTASTNFVVTGPAVSNNAFEAVTPA